MKIKSPMLFLPYRVRGVIGVTLFVVLAWVPGIMAIWKLIPHIAYFFRAEYGSWARNLLITWKLLLRGEGK